MVIKVLLVLPARLATRALRVPKDRKANEVCRGPLATRARRARKASKARKENAARTALPACQVDRARQAKKV